MTCTGKARPPSPNATSVPSESAATTRYVETTEKIGRASSAENPTPIAAITPSSSTVTASAVSSTPGFAPPNAAAIRRNGTATARNASDAVQAARNLPSTSCQPRMSVTCVVARVPASRSPLIAPPDSAGRHEGAEQQHEEHDGRDGLRAAVPPEEAGGREQEEGHAEQQQRGDRRAARTRRWSGRAGAAPGRRRCRRPGRGPHARDSLLSSRNVRSISPAAGANATIRTPSRDERGEQVGGGGLVPHGHEPPEVVRGDAVAARERGVERRRVLGAHPPEPRGVAEGLHPVGVDGLAALHVDGVVGHLLQLREHVARDEHGAALGGEGADQDPEVDPRLRIEAARGLVEQQHRRVVHERAGEAHPLLLPAGEHAGRLVGELVEVHERDELLRPRRGALLREAVQAAGQLERRPRRQRRPGAEHVGHPAGDRADAGGVLERVDPADPDRAGVGGEQRRQHQQQRRLARAVRADQARDAAGGGGEGHAPHGVRRSERPPHPLHDECRQVPWEDRSEHTGSPRLILQGESGVRAPVGRAPFRAARIDPWQHR